MFTQPLTARRAGPVGRIRGLFGREPLSQNECAYDAAMKACTAAHDQIADAPDAWVRYLALCQLMCAHQVAAKVATQQPWPARNGGDGRSVRQVHKDTATLLEWLATTERTLATREPFDGKPLTSTTRLLPQRLADVVIRLSAVPDPFLRAQLIIELSLIAEPGSGPAADVLHSVATAYLKLAGVRTPGAAAARLRADLREVLNEHSAAAEPGTSEEPIGRDDDRVDDLRAGMTPQRAQGGA